MYESSRRLTGPNLYFNDCGAVLEVFETSADAIRRWRERVRAMQAALGWQQGELVASVYQSGASLAFTAQEDQLFTATEVNEWAWLGVMATAGHPEIPLSPGYPDPFDEDSAIQSLRLMAAEERQPEAMALAAEAASRGVPVFWGDDEFSIGAGEGGMAWPMTGLPMDVPWALLHGIPTALVTGSNGKTTTVRLVAAMLEAAGRTTGFNCTDGVFIGGERIERGDYSGPAGARRVLRDPRVQTAVLETARGGILRRGLAVKNADAAIVTNISPDHFGEYGIHSLSDLADAKLVVARAIGRSGLLVLNADDDVLPGKASSLACPLAWFALDDQHPRLNQHRLAGGATCGVRDGQLHLHVHGGTHLLGDITSMPLTLAGLARYNIANIAGASLVAALLGVSPGAIAATLARFGGERGDNPGRLQRWQINGVEVLLDYAHNPDGLAGLMAIGNGLRQQRGGRLGLLLGQAGNRDDDAVRELAAVAAAAKPDFVVLKDLDGYLRGREQGEVPRVLRDALIEGGVPADAIRTILSEVDAAQALWITAQAGDVLVLPVHNLAARDDVVAWLDALALAAV